MIPRWPSKNRKRKKTSLVEARRKRRILAPPYAKRRGEEHKGAYFSCLRATPMFINSLARLLAVFLGNLCAFHQPHLKAPILWGRRNRGWIPSLVGPRTCLVRSSKSRPLPPSNLPVSGSKHTKTNRTSCGSRQTSCQTASQACTWQCTPCWRSGKRRCRRTPGSKCRSVGRGTWKM